MAHCWSPPSAASRSSVATMPVRMSSPANSPASLPTFSGVDTYSPVSSSCGLVSMPASANRPTFPVATWATRMVIRLLHRVGPRRYTHLKQQCCSNAIGPAFNTQGRPRRTLGPMLKSARHLLGRRWIAGVEPYPQQGLRVRCGHVEFVEPSSADAHVGGQRSGREVDRGAALAGAGDDVDTV